MVDRIREAASSNAPRLPPIHFAIRATTCGRELRACLRGDAGRVAHAAEAGGGKEGGWAGTAAESPREGADIALVSLDLLAAAGFECGSESTVLIALVSNGQEESMLEIRETSGAAA